MSNVSLGGAGIPLQQLATRHDHAWSAKTALQAVLFPETLLHGMELTIRRQPFNRGNLRLVCLYS
jgi:hypothetical protein